MYCLKLSKQLLTLKIIFLNMVLNALVVGALHFEAVHGFLCFGYVDLVVISVGHGFSPFFYRFPIAAKPLSAALPEPLYLFQAADRPRNLSPQ